MKKKPPKTIEELSDVSEEVLINNIIYMEKKAYKNRAIMFGVSLLLFMIGVWGFMVFCLVIIPEVVYKWLGL
jgi:hypothetical protein